MSVVSRAVGFVPGLVAGGVLVAYGFAGGGAVLGVAALLAMAALVALALLWGDSPLRRGADRGFAIFLALLPGLLTVYLGFQSGGYFAEDTAVVVVLVATALLIRTVVSPDPFEGVSVAAVVAVAGLAGFAAWTLASAGWSGLPARALPEADRALLYLLVLVLFASIPRSAARLRWMLRGLVAGILVVCVAGLLSRVLPELVSAPLGFADNRLRYPITYWNSLGLLAALGMLFCLHASSDAREPAALRVLAAGAVPPLAVTLLLTVSRGAVLAVAGGVVVYLLVGRPRLALSGVLAVAAPTLLVLRETYERQLLFSAEHVTPAGMAQGGALARQIVAYALIAVIVRAVLLALDGPLVAARLPKRARRPVVVGLWAAFGIAVLVTALAVDAPGRIGAEYERILRSQANPGSANPSDTRARLTDPTDPGRIRQWRVAVGDFRAAPLAGQGAGTWEASWLERRSQPSAVEDAHSLYLEVLGELGLVGMVLLGTALLAILAATLARARGPDRALYAVLFAAILTWAGRAAIDWDWEMPGVTLWVLALGGAVLAVPTREAGRAARPRVRRVRRNPGLRVAAAVATVLAVVPAFAVIRSETRLDVAQAAFVEGDCVNAAAAARAVLAATPRRPEPHEVLGLCAARFGLGPQAADQLERAVALAPRDWRYRYSLGLTRGAAGRDPREELRAAARLNPFEPIVRAAVRGAASGERRAWRRVGQTAELHGDLNG